MSFAASDARVSPRLRPSHSNSICPDMIIAYGLAMFLPAMSGAEPWVACAIGREDIAELVRRDDHVVLLRLHHQLHGHAVDEHFFEFTIRKLLRDFATFFRKHPAHQAIHRLLVHRRNLLAPARSRDLES